MTILITSYFLRQRHYNTNLDPLEFIVTYPPYHYDADFDPLAEFSAF